jgi:lipopolysaccharide export system protein LptA
VTSGALLALASALAAAAPAAPAAKPSPAVAAAAPADGRVRVDAREVQYAFQKREVVFSGEPVTLTHQDARLTCKRLVAKQDAHGEIALAVCQGDVVFTSGARRVTCAKATYDAPAERLVCEGEPVVLQEAGSTARGTRLEYDLKADQAKLENPVVMLPGGDVEARRKALEAQRERKRQGGTP